MSQEHPVTLTVQNNHLVFTLNCERMDYSTKGRINRKITTVLRTLRQVPVILDLSKLKVLSSLAIGLLVDLQPRVRRLFLVGLSEHNRHVLNITGLEKLFDYHATVEDALNALNGPSWRRLPAAGT